MEEVEAEVTPLGEFVELQAVIDTGEESAILARWKFGRILWQEREDNGGKQLPHGRRAEIIRITGQSKSEIAYRIQFFDQYRTREEVATAVDTYRSWTEIRHTLAAPREEGDERPPISLTADSPIAPVFESADWLVCREEMREACPKIPETLGAETDDEVLSRAEAIERWYRAEAAHLKKIVATVRQERNVRDQTKMEVEVAA